MYLDFDGQDVPAGEWGDEINASHSWVNDEAVKTIWQRVSEDFRPFKINVTTDETVYKAAPVGSRMRCIVTLTTMVAPDSGGIAYLGSWADAGAPGYSDDVPCWVFPANLGYDAKAIAEAISHEIGHTLGLSHDGLKDTAGETVEEYYLGHGSGPTGWAPIMGAGYYEPLSQWSRGEYAATVTLPNHEVIDATANNTEDDLAIIASSGNRTGYVADRESGALAEAENLSLTGGGEVDFTGELSRTGDVDAFQFSKGPGSVQLTVGVAAEDSAISDLGNIDAQLELYDFSGSLLATVNPTGAITAELSMDVPPGVYRLRIRGTGEGDVAGEGYSNYGSLGRYRLTGTFMGPAPQVPVIGGALEWCLVKNQVASYQVQALGDPVAFYASGLPPTLAINPATGLISGTPTAPGEYAVMLTVANQQGRASRELNLVVLSGEPGDAVGASDLAWAQGGNRLWVLDREVFVDGRSAIRSGAVQGDEQSWVETTVTGPGELSFRWKVSSEENTWQPGDPWDPETMPDPTAPYDRLEFSMNGERQEFISGDVNWTQRSYAVPAGTHTLRWTYQKDPYTSLGEDAGWLDQVIYARAEPPSMVAPMPAVVGEGAGYSYQIIATNAATSYSATGLPAGLTLDESTGVIRGAPELAGIYTVLLGATNPHGTASASLILTVQTRFVAWSEARGLVNAPSLAQADADGDGWPNLIEYAFGSNPMVGDATVGPSFSFVEHDELIQLEIEFVRPLDRPDLTYTVEVSSDLASWVQGHAYGPTANNTEVDSTEQISRSFQADGGEKIRVRDVGGAGEARFMRVRVALP
ncbi:MAG: putative Ig domain-containing protein [Rariglobus sp.]